MTKQYFEVTVEYTGTKTYRIPTNGDTANTLVLIGENLTRLDKIWNSFYENEEFKLLSIEYQEWKD